MRSKLRHFFSGRSPFQGYSNNLRFYSVVRDGFIFQGHDDYVEARKELAKDPKKYEVVDNNCLVDETVKLKKIRSVSDVLLAIKELYQGRFIYLKEGQLPLVPQIPHPLELHLTSEKEFPGLDNLYSRDEFYNNINKKLEKDDEDNSSKRRGIDEIQVLPLYGLWFRGQHSVTYDLKPSIYRHEVNNLYYESPSMYSLFRHDNPQLDESLKSTFEWLTTMQHYGLPTPLLDWSEGVLQALYFAVHPGEETKKENMDKDAVVYILNGYKLNALTLKYFAVPPGFRSNNYPENSLIFKPDDFHTIIRAEMIDSRSVEHLQSKKDVRFSIDSIKHRYDKAEKILMNPFDALFREDTTDKGTFQYDVHAEQLVGHLVNKYSSLKVNSSNSAYGGIIIDDSESNKSINEIKHEMDIEIRNIFFGNPVAIAPRRTNPRLKAQAGVFTLHSGKNEVLNGALAGEDVRSLPVPPKCLKKLNKCQPDENKFLFRFDIDKKYKESIRRELAALGINESSMYGDLQSQSKYMSRHWIFHKNEIISENQDENGDIAKDQRDREKGNGQ